MLIKSTKFKTSEFCCWIEFNTKLQQLTFMLISFQGPSVLQKSYVKKNNGTPPYLSCNIIKISTFQDQIWWRATNIRNSNFDSSERVWTLLKHISWKLVHPLYREEPPPEISTKKIMKIEDFRIANFRQIRWWSALTFFRMILPNFSSALKRLRHKFWLLKLYIYGKKVNNNIQNTGSCKSSCFSLVLLRTKYGRVPPIFRTTILEHLK